MRKRVPNEPTMDALGFKIFLTERVKEDEESLRDGILFLEFYKVMDPSWKAFYLCLCCALSYHETLLCLSSVSTSDAPVGSSPFRHSNWQQSTTNKIQSGGTDRRLECEKYFRLFSRERRKRVKAHNRVWNLSQPPFDCIHWTFLKSDTQVAYFW